MDAEQRATEASARRLRERIRSMFGRSLQIRHVDAGSCYGCELELQTLTNPYYDMNRLNLFFTTSPRHADMLLVTGPVTRNMELALKNTYDAMPEPKIVAACGTCACNGGLFSYGDYAAATGLDVFLPVDVYIPGSPPNPLALIQGLLAVLDRMEQKARHQRIVIGPETSDG